MEGISEAIDFLINYPIEEKEYPKGYPEDLKFDPYPGKDYVIGVCDETIEEALQLYAVSKKEASKEALKLWIGLLREVREHRKRKLNPPKPMPKTIESDVTVEDIKATLF